MIRITITRKDGSIQSRSLRSLCLYPQPSGKAEPEIVIYPADTRVSEWIPLSEIESCNIIQTREDDDDFLS